MSSEKRGGVRKTVKSGTKQKRSSFKHPYLEPSVSLLKRRDDVEDVASYAHKLNEEEKVWMNQFMKEYNDAHTKDAVFHKTAAERKICHDKNNARNRCWYTEEKAANRLNLVESDHELESMVEDIDNEINEEEIYLETNVKRYWD